MEMPEDLIEINNIMDRHNVCLTEVLLLLKWRAVKNAERTRGSDELAYALYKETPQILGHAIDEMEKDYWDTYQIMKDKYPQIEIPPKNVFWWDGKSS